VESLQTFTVGKEYDVEDVDDDDSMEMNKQVPLRT
jgi:hypothetical protein